MSRSFPPVTLADNHDGSPRPRLWPHGTLAFGLAVASLVLLGGPRVIGAQGDPPWADSRALAPGSRDFRQAEEEMERLYAKVLRVYQDDSQFLVKFRRSQQAWLAFREASLEAQFPSPTPQASYGSVYPQCADRLRAGFTEQRIRQLQEWLDGVEEGEVCAGAMHYRQ